MFGLDGLEDDRKRPPQSDSLPTIESEKFGFPEISIPPFLFLSVFPASIYRRPGITVRKREEFPCNPKRFLSWFASCRDPCPQKIAINDTHWHEDVRKHSAVFVSLFLISIPQCCINQSRVACFSYFNPLARLTTKDNSLGQLAESIPFGGSLICHYCIESKWPRHGPDHFKIY